MQLHCTGLPHSDTDGSPRVCRSPSLFAAYRVLLRRLEPRHPPGALLLILSPPTYKISSSRTSAIPDFFPEIRLLLTLYSLFSLVTFLQAISKPYLYLSRRKASVAFTFVSVSMSKNEAFS